MNDSAVGSRVDVMDPQYTEQAIFEQKQIESKLGIDWLSKMWPELVGT